MLLNHLTKTKDHAAVTAKACLKQLSALAFVILLGLMGMCSSASADEQAYDQVMDELLEAVGLQHYDQVHNILRSNPDFVQHTNTLDCPIICDLNRHLRFRMPEGFDPHVYVTVIDIALEHGVIPDAGSQTLRVLDWANSLGFPDDPDLPWGSGHCLPIRDLLVPLVHRLAAIDFDHTAFRSNFLSTPTTQSFWYIVWLCEQPVTCGAAYEVPPSPLRERLAAALTPAEGVLLDLMARTNVLDRQCLTPILPGFERETRRSAL